MIIDLIIIAVIAMCIIMGYKKGLIEVGFRLVSFIIAIVLSLALYTPVANYIIENTKIDDVIKETIQANINPETIEKVEEPEENNNMPDIVTNYISKTVKEATDTAKDNISQVIASNISITAVKIIALVGIFIVIRLVLGILKVVTNAISKLPIINSANKLRRNCIWLIRGLINYLYCISNSNGNKYSYGKQRNIANNKSI